LLGSELLFEGGAIIGGGDAGGNAGIGQSRVLGNGDAGGSDGHEADARADQEPVSEAHGYLSFLRTFCREHGGRGMNGT
jgi:hypothetical protein